MKLELFKPSLYDNVFQMTKSAELYNQLWSKCEVWKNDENQLEKLKSNESSWIQACEDFHGIFISVNLIMDGKIEWSMDGHHNLF